MTNENFKLANILTLIVTIISLISTVVYGTWFVSEIEKRISILEDENSEFAQRINEFRDSLNMANVQQDHAQHRFEDQITKRVNRLEDKIDGEKDDVLNSLNENHGRVFVCTPE